MTARTAVRPRDALARLLPLPLVVLVAGCGGPDAAPDAERPSPFADCAALTAPPKPGPGATAAGGPAPADGAGRAAPAGDPTGLPDLTLPCFTGGQPVRLTGVRGPAVVNLWGSWCEPCRTELPAVQRLADRTAGRLHVIGVDTVDTRDAAGSFAADNGVRFATLYDRDKQLMSALGLTNLPATVFVDRTGATYVHRGRALDDAALTDLADRHTGVAVRP